mmetsp:Transcript_34009/g.73629  ORF Transcript_34009/g.73629 Transcript_34009/m.73629 type:complete len:326 (-) Transcript_34009:59-1036(-)
MKRRIKVCFFAFFLLLEFFRILLHAVSRHEGHSSTGVVPGVLLPLPLATFLEPTVESALEVIRFPLDHSRTDQICRAKQRPGSLAKREIFRFDHSAAGRASHDHSLSASNGLLRVGHEVLVLLDGLHPLGGVRDLPHHAQREHIRAVRVTVKLGRDAAGGVKVLVIGRWSDIHEHRLAPLSLQHLPGLHAAHARQPAVHEDLPRLHPLLALAAATQILPLVLRLRVGLGCHGRAGVFRLPRGDAKGFRETRGVQRAHEGVADVALRVLHGVVRLLQLLLIRAPDEVLTISVAVVLGGAKGAWKAAARNWPPKSKPRRPRAAQTAR